MDALAVFQLGGQVEGFRVGARRHPAGGLDGVGQAAARRQGVDAGFDHRPGDVDDQWSGGRRRQQDDRPAARLAAGQVDQAGAQQAADNTE